LKNTEKKLNSLQQRMVDQANSDIQRLNLIVLNQEPWAITMITRAKSIYGRKLFDVPIWEQANEVYQNYLTAREIISHIDELQKKITASYALIHMPTSKDFVMAEMLQINNQN
jgi:hypothetical protein